LSSTRPVVALLSCLTPTGRRHYDLPALPFGEAADYSVFWRPLPAPVIHHQMGKQFELPQAEFVFVALKDCHCVSLSVDERGFPNEGYVNINETPLLRRDGWLGWSWRDLFLDVKLSRGRAGWPPRWTPIVLDWEEYEAAAATQLLTKRQRVLAVAETARVLERVRQGVFPFHRLDLPFLGLAVPPSAFTS
jgi:predicted RNA-binding protein associated with RNAse of E/G family